MWTALQSRLVRNEEGASLVEYALLVALIAVVAIIAITVVGKKVSNNFDSIAQEL
ncbi:MAG TPA: Flp family type IVb pilin [Acidimicrobiia bacterium]|jgi:pilus assembly protein Flp/PilA